MKKITVLATITLLLSLSSLSLFATDSGKMSRFGSTIDFNKIGKSVSVADFRKMSQSHSGTSALPQGDIEEEDDDRDVHHLLDAETPYWSPGYGGKIRYHFGSSGVHDSDTTGTMIVI